MEVRTIYLCPLFYKATGEWSHLTHDGTRLPKERCDYPMKDWDGYATRDGVPYPIRWIRSM